MLRATSPLLLTLMTVVATATATEAASAGRGRGRSRLLNGDDALASPGEMAWRAWLLMERPPTAAAAVKDGAGGGDGDVEVGAARRLATRSIFVVQGSTTRRPPPPCGEGFRANAVGGCHMVINVGMVLAPPPPTAAADETIHEAGWTVLEGSGAPSESAAEAIKIPSERSVTALNDRKTIYSVMRENANRGSDYKRKRGWIRMLPTSSEQYRHMLPIIGGDQDQEIPFSEVRVRGID